MRPPVLLRIPLLLSIFLPFPFLFSVSLAHPPSHLHPLLHLQALSHLFFHSPPSKLSLASLFSAPRSSAPVAIVGVEWGADLSPLASAGFRVYAFEPAPEFAAHLRHLLRDNPAWNVTLVQAAAGNSSHGVAHLRYQNYRVADPVPRTTVDRHVAETLAVLSVDVQGDELGVLQGAAQLLADHGVLSLWVEGIACNQAFLKVLEMLDADYVMFDFVPWGKRKGGSADVPRGRESFVYEPGRPSGLSEFCSWMCARKEDGFEWLQTDVVAVRRDQLTGVVWERLASLGRRLCGGRQPVADCCLRRLLEHEGNEDKEEL